MAKNRVDINRRPKDNFFQKSRKNFRKPKFQYNNEETKLTPSTESSNFFIKSNNPSTSSTAKVSTSHDSQGKNEAKAEKKPFDKKKYRLKKYSNKYQLQQWEDKRKKAVLRSYYKSIKEDQSNPVSLHDENSTEDDVQDSKKPVDTEENPKQKKFKPFRKAHEEFQRIREEKEKKKELFLQRKKEKEEAAQKYKKNKVEKFKKLNKKTKKGQPIMKDRLEMLLEKIQSSIQQE